MLTNPLLGAILATLARREAWDFEVRTWGGEVIARRDAAEVRAEFHDMQPGEWRPVGDCLIVRVARAGQ